MRTQLHNLANLGIPSIWSSVRASDVPCKRGPWTQFLFLYRKLHTWE